MGNDFERELAELAKALLAQKHPYVADKNIGFNLVDHDDKEQKGVGFFVLNLNGTYMYVPIFFVNGQLKDLVLLYNKDRDKFFPLSERWVDHFESYGKKEMGEGIRDMPEIIRSPFNFYRMNNPGMLGLSKVGSDQKEGEKLKRFLTTGSNSLRYKTAKLFQKSPLFAEKMASMYTRQEIIDMLSKQEKLDYVKQGSLRIVDDWQSASELDKVGKAMFMKLGYYIDDKRKNLDYVYQFKERPSLHTVDHDDIYEVCTNDGIKKCLISISPFCLGEGTRKDTAIVMDVETKKYCTHSEPESLFVMHTDAGLLDTIKKLKTIPVKKMRKGKKYMLFDHKHGGTGKFSVPFNVQSKVTKKDGHVMFDISSFEFGPSHCERFIETCDRDHLAWLDNDIRVGANYMAVEVGDDVLCVHSKNVARELGKCNHDCIKIANLVEYKNGTIVDKYNDKKDAIVKVAHKYNIHALEVVDHIETGKDFFVKKSNARVMAQPGSNADYSIEDIDNRDIDEYYYNELQDAKTSPQRNFEGVNKSTVEEDINKLTALSNMDSSMKVFEEGAIAMLSGLQDPGKHIRMWIPDMVNCLDKLGRYIHAMWYHAYKIKDAFAINEYSEMETRLIDTFENLGEIILDTHGKDLARKI